MTMTKPPLLIGALCALTLSLGACSGKEDEGRGNRAAQVGYVVVQQEAVPLTTSLGGRTVAFETSEVRPQVNGIIRRRLFTEGGFVRAGQALYQIDASLYRAAVDQAEANLASARASAQAAEEKAKRFEPLAKIQAVAQQDYSDALAQARSARAAVAQNAAALETARINLRYTSLSAPISGRIGRSLVTPGGLASANQATPLAVIQQTDPIYVDMQQSSADLTRLRQALASGGVTPGSTSVRLKLEDGSDYGFAGTVQFSEVTVNEGTGTVTLRARFPNPQGLLLPGMFVRAIFAQSVDNNAYLVPQAGVKRDPKGSATVLVVSADNKAVERKVNATRVVGANWVVTDGLKPGDKVITEGVARAKIGQAVKPVPAGSAQKLNTAPAKGGDKSAQTKN